MKILLDGVFKLLVVVNFSKNVDFFCKKDLLQLAA